MEPVPPPPHVFTLGGGELRLASFSPVDGGGLEIAALNAVELAADTFADGFLGGAARDPMELEGRVGSLLEAVGGTIEQASLVLPDAWLRVTFIGLDELPQSTEDRDEVLRWKLKRLVPFRVEDLRLAGTLVTPLPEQGEPVRMMVGYALDSLVAQLERAFAAHGVRIGRVTNASLALLKGVEGVLGDARLGALVLVEPGAYTLVLSDRGEAVLHRFKPQKLNPDDPAVAGLVRRDLKLTLSFLEEQYPEASLDRCLLAAPADVEDAWLGRLAGGLGMEPMPLRPAHLPLESAPPGAAWDELGPLVGAASWEVA